MVACSIGMAIKGVPVLGVICNPFLDMLYTAAEGKGAYLNEKTKLPIANRELNSLGEALIAVEYGSSRRDPALQNKLSTFKSLTGDKQDGGKMVHSLRSVGSAALNICFVASGSLDMYWEIGCWPWDVCVSPKQDLLMPGWYVYSQGGRRSILRRKGHRRRLYWRAYA